MGGAGAVSRILVVGDVVDDILARPRRATAYASDTEAEIDQQPGGSAANVAAWLGAAGADVAFVGRAGRDGATRHSDALRALGVDAHIVSDPTLRTAAIVLLVDEAGERTMYVDRGANAALRSEDVPTGAWHELGWLHLTGYSFLDPAVRPVVTTLMHRAQASGVHVSVDPSSAGFLERVSPQAFLEWTHGTSLLIPNLAEARLLSGERDVDTAARALLAHAAEVVVTCSADGAVRYAAGETPVRQPARMVEVVDTTGAGDAFCAGMLASRVTGRTVRQQLSAAAELAARCVVRLGARPA